MENKILRKLVAFMLLIAMNINMFGTNLMLDPNSQHNTKLDTSANGTPIINISTPNSRGVSINEFLEYNVGHEGQVLNNADNMGRSHIAGMINANPNLGPNQAANLIILQVNGANRSQIEGYIEALSRNRVDVVLSNENGIYLNGAGTINVRKFTPATGRVTLKDGDVVGIDVEKGRVVIGANGFDATNTDYVNIIAKSLEMQGNLVGNRVDVILGENFVDNNGAVTSKGGINSVAIDAGNLGSMYAGQVRIVSTDKGAGVNSGALIYSKNEKLEITADGKINVAKIKGNGIEIKGSDYTQTELASSDRDINITANTVKLSGQTQAQGNVGLNADVENASEILANGNLKTKKLTNTGKVKVLKKVEITGELDNGGSLISVDGVTVAKDVKNTGEISTNDDFTAKNVVSSGKVFGKNIQADDVDNSGKMLAKGKFTAKNVKNTGEIASGDKISAKKLENSGTAATSSDISVSDSLVNHNGGNIEGKNVEVKGPELRNAGKISAGNIRSKVNEVINSGQVHSSRDVDFDTQKLTNTGEILAVNDVNSAGADVTNNGKIASNNRILLDNSKIANTGEILSGNISMQNAQKFDNTGTIKANNTVLTTTQDINLTGNLHGEQRLAISGRNITNNGNTTGAGIIQITSNDFTNNRDLSSDTVIINGQGNIVNNAVITGDSGKISGNDITNNDLVAFEKYLEINAQNKVQNNKDKTIYGGQTLIIKGNGILNDEGEILGGNMTLDAGKIVNNVGTVQATGDILITSGDFQNIGRVSNLGNYEKYYETWEGRRVSESDISNNWKMHLEAPSAKTKHSDDSKNQMRNWLRGQISADEINGYSSIMFKKYPNLGFDFLDRVGKKGDDTYYTGTARVPEIPLKGKLESNASTEYGKIQASGNITINSANTRNRDSIISAGGTVDINSSNLENSVTTGNAVQLRDGQEIFRIYFKRGKKNATSNAFLKRDFVNGDIAYEAGQPSIIEGSAVNINAPVITSPITEANGKINIGSVAHGVAGSLFTGTVGKGISSANGTVQVANNMSSVQSVLNTGTISVNPLLTGAMFTQNMNPGSKYLLETRSKYVDLNKYYGSDYFLSRLGYTPGWNRVRRLGDAYYENQLITRALTERLGTAFINGKSNEELIKSLMDNAGMESSRLGLQVGKELTPEQISGLSKDLVWYVTQNVNGVEVLVPKIYLSKNTLDTITADGRNKIGGVNGTYIKTDNFVNNGMKIGNGGVTYVQANTVRNETATNLLSEITGDRTFIHSDGNIENIGGRINGNEAVALISDNGKVTNDTTKRTFGHYNGEFDRTRHEEVKSLGTISSQGTVFVKADSYESTGGMLSADHLALDVNKVNLNTLSLSGEDKFGSGGSNFSRYAETTHLGAGVSANSASGTVGDMNLKGSSFIAEDTTGLTVTGNIKAESAVNIYENESRSTGKGFMSSSSSYRNSHTEENSASNLMLGKNAVIRGNIEGIGSNIVLGENTYVGGKVTTDAQQLHNSYFEENRKKGFSGGISHGTASLSYGKSQNTYDEKSTVNAKSNLQVGDGSVLNRGAEITATNFEYGNIQINNGDVKYGARIDTRDVRTESKSSSFGISAGVNSPMLDRAKQVAGAVEQVKNGDTAGGAMEAINAATGTIKGLSDNQGTRQTNYDANGSVGKQGAKNASANNNFYANIGVNAGISKSKSTSNSHTESAVVTTMKPADENSSITYNNVNNITYQGTQAQGGTFIYNNVANIQKEAVELHNSYTSSSSSRGINAGATIGYGHKIQTTGNGGSISASKSNQNTTETIYQNGNFQNVNEVHNNTGTMTLSGFNQEGGKVTGNIGNLVVESRQNTSTTTGSSKGVNLGISANGVPSSVNINASRTNGNRAFVDNQSSFIVGEGSNLHVGTVENTGALIGKQGNSTFKIDTYVGKDIQNYDTMTTTGGSIGVSLGGKPKITNVGFNQESRDKQGITRNTVVGDVEITKAEGNPINRDLGKANEVTKDTHSRTNINVEPQVIEYLTNPGKLKEDIGKAKDEIEAVGAVAKAAFNTIGSKEKNSFFDFLRTERVQETVRNLGYIDTKGKTKEQIAQEMQDKYGEIFVKNSKKLEINFYVNSEVSQDDPNGKNKMNSAGFVAEDSSIWLNADNISSISNFNLNSVFGHELTHNVTGKDTELLANFGEARASGFIEKAMDKGYLARTGGGLNWNSETLTKEQKDRLASYQDIEEKLKPINYLAVDIKRDENDNIISITKDNVLISEIEKAIKNKFDLENFNFPSKILSLDIEGKKHLSDEIYKELEIEFKQKLEDYSKSGYKNQILNQLMEKYDISENDINIAIQDVDKYISSLDGQKAIKNDILKRSDIKNNIESILTNSGIDNKSKINKIKDKYGIIITEKELKDSKNTIMKVIEDVSLKNIIIQDSNKIANDSRWKSQRFRDFFANNQKLTNMQLVIDEDDFVHYIDSKTKSGRLNNLFETIGDVSFVSGKDIQVEKVAVKIDNQIYQKEIVKIKDDAKPISKFKDEQIINNPKEMFIGNTEYKTGNNSIKEIIDSDKTIFYEPTIGNAQARALDNNAFYNNGKKGSGADTRVEMDFNYTALYKVYGHTDKDGLINIASVTPYASYQVYAHEALGHGAHNQKGENTGSKEFYQAYRDQNKEIHFQGELTGFQVSIENLTPEKIFNNIISDLKNQKITAIDKKNNIVTINPKILNELNNKNSEYYKYLYKEIEEKFREAKQNNNTIINLNLPFSTRKLEEKNTVNLENEILKDQGKKNFLRGVY